MTNLKDTLSTICGLIVALCTALLGITQFTLPAWVNVTATILIAVAGAVLGFLQGRNPDGSKKKTPINQ